MWKLGNAAPWGQGLCDKEQSITSVCTGYVYLNSGLCSKLWFHLKGNGRMDYYLGNHQCPASQVVLVVKNLPANAGDARDTGSIPGSGRSPRVGSGSPSLQYSCLGNPMDRGAWGRKELYTIEQLSTFIALFVVGEDLWDNLFPTSLRYDWQNFIYLGCIMWFFLGV